MSSLACSEGLFASLREKSLSSLEDLLAFCVLNNESLSSPDEVVLVVVVDAVTCLASELPPLFELPVEDSALASPPSDAFSVCFGGGLGPGNLEASKEIFVECVGVYLMFAKEDDNLSAKASDDSSGNCLS